MVVLPISKTTRGALNRAPLNLMIILVERKPFHKAPFHATFRKNDAGICGYNRKGNQTVCQKTFA